jgi:hypothetical protein
MKPIQPATHGSVASLLIFLHKIGSITTAWFFERRPSWIRIKNPLTASAESMAGSQSTGTIPTSRWATSDCGHLPMAARWCRFWRSEVRRFSKRTEQVITAQSPEAREGAGIAYDVALGRTIIFGRENRAVLKSDTWELSP